jgi:hypothetical protein
MLQGHIIILRCRSMLLKLLLLLLCSLIEIVIASILRHSSSVKVITHILIVAKHCMWNHASNLSVVINIASS